MFYDDFPIGTVVRLSDAFLSLMGPVWSADRATDAGVVEDGDPFSGALDVRWASWPVDTTPCQPVNLTRATPEWLAANGYTVTRPV